MGPTHTGVVFFRGALPRIEKLTIGQMRKSRCRKLYIESQSENEATRQDSLDALEEERDLAASRSMIYQQDLCHYHSHRVHSRTFQEGNLVLRSIQDQTGMHKLSPPWEGPFVVSKNLNNGSYYLIDIREHNKSRTSEEETNSP